MASDAEVFERAAAEAAQLAQTPAEETEPYKHLYAARKVLEAARETLEERGADELAARLRCRAGVNKFLTEENTDGQSDMVAGAQALEGRLRWAELEAAWEAKAANAADGRPAVTNGQAIIELINTYNYLGILWSHRADGTEKARQFLERAHALYAYAHEAADPADAPHALDLEETRTNTLFFLAQVYTSAGDAARGARMCVQTLARQRRFQHSFDPLRWARDAVGLAAYYGSALGRTRLGSHMLCAALRALAEAEAHDADEVRGLVADVLRAKGALLQSILETAVRLHLEAGGVTGDWASEERQSALAEDMTIDDHAGKDERPPTVQTVANFEAAREVFKSANAAFEKAKEHYVLDGYTSDHVTILKSQSQLYRLIAAFESDPKRIAAMHLRREKLLSHLLDELNAEFYAVEHQEVAYELGEASREMLAATLARAVPEGDRQSGAEPSKPADIKRVNDTAFKAVKYYSHYIAAFERAEKEDQKNGSAAPEPKDLVPLLASHFWIAHAYRKMVPPDPTSVPARVLLLHESLKYFNKVCELGAERLPKDSPLFKEERDIAAQLVELLPAEIARMQQIR